MPAGGGAARAFELTEVAFDEGAGLSELAQGKIAGFGVPVGSGRIDFHNSKVLYLLFMATKKWSPKKKSERFPGERVEESTNLRQSRQKLPTPQLEESVIRNRWANII
jgi:hypothetical protein